MNNMIVSTYSSGQTVAEVPFTHKGYVNATLMCKPFGKLPADFLRLKATKRLVKALENNHLSDMGISHNAIGVPILKIRGGNLSEIQQGTWVNDILAIKLAEWLRPEFGVWTALRIRELLSTGFTMNTKLSPESEDLLVARAMQIMKDRETRARESNKLLQADAKSYQKLQASDSLYTITKAGSILAIIHPKFNKGKKPLGRNQFFKLLRDDKYLSDYGRTFNHPFAKYIQQGLFEVKAKVLDNKFGTAISQTFMTTKGLAYFQRKYNG